MNKKPTVAGRLAALTVKAIPTKQPPAKAVKVAVVHKPAKAPVKAVVTPPAPAARAFGGAVVRTASAVAGAITGFIDSWSFSRLNDWRKCPRMAWYKHVQKIREPGNKYTLRGTLIHQMAQDFVEGKLKKLPPELLKFKAKFEELKKLKAVCEEQWAFSPQWKEETWFAKVYKLLRVKTDACVVVKKDTVRIIDFKTGKVNEDHEEQLSLYALAAFVKYPEAKWVAAELWYLDSGDLTEQLFPVSDLPELKRYWVEAADGMFKDRGFNCKPGNACRFCWFRKSNLEYGKDSAGNPTGGPCQY